jgi:hypothetical protein
VSDALTAWLTGGIKAVRFLCSSRYRQRVREHWQLFPQRRTRGILRMVWGTIFDIAIIWGLMAVKWHR